MSAGEYSFTIECGTNFSLALVYKDSSDVVINITNYSAKLDIKTAVGGTLQKSMSSSTDDITIGGSNGTITLALNTSETSALTPGRYVYDLELTNASGNVERLLEGNVTVKGQVTTS